MAKTTLSAADQTRLSPQQQTQIKNYKQQWQQANAAGDQAGMKAAHQGAEQIRAQAGYSGGADGSEGKSLRVNRRKSALDGGEDAGQVQKWVEDYYYTNLDARTGWINGFSTQMNLRSVANYIRQQMQANTEAWNTADEAGKAYLHDQNKQLAKILASAAGGAESTYNEALGRWETNSANYGYGYNTGSYRDEEQVKRLYGMTDEEIERYRNDTDRYYNYVDQGIVRNWQDESSGYTGSYAQFVHGPYGQLLDGTKDQNPATYVDLIGDGFGEESITPPRKDADGNFIRKVPQLKNNNTMNDYTRQFASFVDDNGIIQPGTLVSASPGGLRHRESVLPKMTEMGSSYPKEDRIPAGTVVEDAVVVDAPMQSVMTTGGSMADALYAAVGSGNKTPVSGSKEDVLDTWQQSAMAQAAATTDRAVDRAVQELLQAQAEAGKEYDQRRDQIAKEEMTGLDNAALYAEVRGDRGGIGKSQYDYVQAQADANRQTVAEAQTQMSADTAKQIAQLRADGEFEKADEMMEIAQTYLLKLLEMEQWAAEYNLDVAKFQQSVRQWEQEYRLSLAKALI